MHRISKVGFGPASPTPPKKSASTVDDGADAFVPELSTKSSGIRIAQKQEVEGIQLKVYTRWWGSWLANCGYELADDGLVWAVRNGALPIKLLEALEKKPEGALAAKERVVLKPKNKFERMANLSIFHSLLMEPWGVTDLTNIGPEDLENGDVKLVLGLTWKLILHYEPALRGNLGGALNGMISWMRSLLVAPEYGLSLPDHMCDDLLDALADGKAFCAVVHATQPIALDYQQALTLPPTERLKLAFTACGHFGIPALLDESDLTTHACDANSLATYLAKLRAGLTAVDATSVYEASIAAEKAKAEAAAIAEARAIKAAQAQAKVSAAVASAKEATAAVASTTAAILTTPATIARAVSDKVVTATASKSGGGKWAVVIFGLVIALLVAAALGEMFMVARDERLAAAAAAKEAAAATSVVNGMKGKAKMGLAAVAMGGFVLVALWMCVMGGGKKGEEEEEEATGGDKGWRRRASVPRLRRNNTNYPEHHD